MLFTLPLSMATLLFPIDSLSSVLLTDQPPNLDILKTDMGTLTPLCIYSRARWLKQRKVRAAVGPSSWHMKISSKPFLFPCL